MRKTLGKTGFFIKIYLILKEEKMNWEEKMIFVQQLNRTISPVRFCPYCNLSIVPYEAQKEGYHKDCWQKEKTEQNLKASCKRDY